VFQSPISGSQTWYDRRNAASAYYVSIPYKRVTNQWDLTMIKFLEYVSIPYKRVTNPATFWTASKADMVSIPYKRVTNREARGLADGQNQVSIPYKRVTNPSPFSISFYTIVSFNPL